MKAADYAYGRPKRTLEAISRDIERFLSGAMGYDPDKLLEEYEQAKHEEEAERGRR